MGLIVGWAAQRFTGYRSGGCISTILLGVIGAFVGGFLYNTITDERRVMDFSVGSVLVSIVGAGLLCLVLRALGQNKRNRNKKRR